MPMSLFFAPAQMARRGRRSTGQNGHHLRPGERTMDSNTSSKVEQAAAALRQLSDSVSNPGVTHTAIETEVARLTAAFSPADLVKLARAFGISRTVPSGSAA